MSKKRVHELAKELGMDNREVVLALQAAGISVKTHSSSVYEEEALAVLNKMKGPAAPPPAAARRPGMVIVKKRRDVESDEADSVSVDEADGFVATQATHDSREAEEQHVASSHRDDERDGEAVSADDDDRDDDKGGAQPVLHAEQSAPPPTEDVDPARSSPPVAQETVPPPAAPVAPTEPPPPTLAAGQETSKARTEHQKADSERVASQTKQSHPQAPPQSRRPDSQPQQQQQPQQHGSHQPSHRRPDSRPQGQGAGPAGQGNRPAGGGGYQGRGGSNYGGRPQGGSGGQSHHNRPQSGRGGPTQHQGAQGGSGPVGQGAQGQQGGSTGPANRTTRPSTTTPATVVRMIDRDKLLERVPGRRLGGERGRSDNRSGDRSGGDRSGAAGGQRYGQVTELKVVTDPFGRGREMIAVGRDKKKSTPAGAPGAGGGPGGGKAPAGRKGRPTGKREMLDMRERALHPARLKKKKTNKRTPGKTVMTQPKASKRVIKMKETIVVADLAHQMGVKSVDIIRKLMALGTMVTQNQSIDFDTTQLVAADFEYTVESVAFTEDAHIEIPESTADASKMVTRPPVVTVMGHVDHGKTSLLDAIRKARVAAGEHGGITQHIGAYSVSLSKKGSVTFLDTPGHAAFTAMRARGAKVTDLVVLVVAADDGVMPQTEEAIKHAQAAGVPIIVAVNKIDKPEAQPDRVMQELTKFDLLPEAWGGETLFVNTSATKGTGIKELLDAILLQAEVLELKANPDRSAVGVVVEAQLDRGRGPVATVLVQQGTLRRGDAIVVGSCSGRIRAMMDDQGRQVKEAGPSSAVEVTGLDAVPEAGDTLNVVETPEAARQVAEHRMSVKKAAEQAGGAAMSLDDLMKRMEGAGGLELKVVLKADVQGSAEAVREALLKLSTDEVKVNVIYGGVGAISESDIMLAAASRGLVLGFGVRPDSNARQVAEREGVEIRTYNIIYEAVSDITKAMEGLLKPESREKVVGRAEVRELFKVSKVGVIGGCRVTEGKAMRNARVRVLRDNVQVYEGRIASLRHFKNDAREVDAGLECGVGVEGYNDLKMGDVIEFYTVEEIARSLNSGPTGNKRSSGGAEAHP